MFSLQKLLVLAAIIAAIWYGFKMVGRLDRARKRKMREEASRGGGETRRDQSRDDVIDLVQGEDGDYVPRDRRDGRS